MKQPEQHGPGPRPLVSPRVRVATVTALAVALLLAGCAVRVPPAPRIVITPASGAVAAPPEAGLVVRAEGGRLAGVHAYAGKDPVPGAFDPSHTTWRSSRSLRPGTTYVVDAIALGEQGVAARLASRFRTLRRAPDMTGPARFSREYPVRLK